MRQRSTITWLLLRWMLLLSGASVLLVLLIHMQAYPDADLSKAFVQAGCRLPCLIGMTPDVTTHDEAIALLEAQAWTEEVRVVDYRTDHYSPYSEWWLSWTWHSDYPAVFNQAYPGRIHVSRRSALDPSIVKEIRLYTRLPTDAFRQWLGPPASGEAFIDVDGRLNYSLMYPDLQIKLTTRLACPARLIHYWYSQAELVVSTRLADQPFVSVEDAVKLCHDSVG